MKYDAITSHSTVLLTRAGRTVACIVAASLLGGCGMSSLTSGLGGGLFGSSSSEKTIDSTGGVNEEQLLSAAKADSSSGVSVGEVAHGCPKFLTLPRENSVTIYEAGRAGDSLGVMHKGEITNLKRECQIEPGRVTVKYGFSGRVLLGPRGQPGIVSMPLLVNVVDAKREKVTGDAMKVEVPVSLEKPIGYFSAVRTVQFNIPEGTRPGEFEMNVGFDRTMPGAG